MKKAFLINGPFAWTLKVDEHTIHFTGRDNAQYFDRHYSELGYEVLWDESYYDNPNNLNFHK